MVQLTEQQKMQMVDRQKSILYVCGRCAHYDEDKNVCPKCFPNIKLEATQSACIFFSHSRSNRKMFINKGKIK